ncbi:inhibitor of the pro-sigma K processing machinery [Caldalkalibacillus uzonensis]|uniref:Inhibitor of the pro-sigma K processing machinery n=1 Tax=Caldalkalibacillus uzonensis TaxID=353224 RepID=A0ABU0CW12_9BACI|nr:pro-sigmaK processing inhibitor BofA family protein [Caldalkalibacillus uzonensis]MDQ0340613.1 inhibitor of the pro-sigma K processing machinery [Caldalkalibacillus uzonensis]
MDAIGISMILVVFLAVMSIMFRMRGRVWHWLGRGLVQLVIGVFLLFVFNLFGSYVDVYVPYNLITMGIAAVLGIPGVLALFGIQLFIM